MLGSSSLQCGPAPGWCFVENCNCSIQCRTRSCSPPSQLSACLALCLQVMSQDLIRATMEIPFSVPPYSALLGRSVASLEGIALLGDPNYQACQFCHVYVCVCHQKAFGNGAG